MSNLNPIYRKYIDDEKYIKPQQIVRGKFYLIKEYEYADGTNQRFQESQAPIVFTLYVSKMKDIIHAVKVTDVKPNIVKKLFGKFVNDDTHLFEMKGNAKSIYKKVINTIPAITSNSYRTYKLSGIKKIMELDMELNKLLPTNKQVVGMNTKYQKKNI
jgi:hypothetical protein